MTKLIDTKPDKIEQISGGKYQFYFTDSKDPNTLPAGAKMLIVYSPADPQGAWQATRYRIAAGRKGPNRVQMISTRELTAEEIAHFEGLIEGESS